MTNVHVLIPSYNCSEWIERCLDSLHEQTQQPASVLLIDDASTEEGYGELASSLCSKYGYAYHRNEKNFKCPYNLRLGISLMEIGEEDVIFLLDGDDYLPPNALERIAEIYSDSKIWMTYGNYEPKPTNTGQTLASEYPDLVKRRNSYRSAPSHFNHPITFRKFLWDQITDRDLQTNDRRWFRGGYDRVIIVPFLEMCGPQHYKFINETLYYYNAVNPISDSHVNINLIHESNQTILRKKKPRLRRRERTG